MSDSRSCRCSVCGRHIYPDGRYSVCPECDEWAFEEIQLPRLLWCEDIHEHDALYATVERMLRLCSEVTDSLFV